jgi:hypothetical protein
MSSNPALPGYTGLFIFLAFMAAMVWIVWLGRRRNQFHGPSEVTVAQQAMLGQYARAYYVDPQHRLCDPETPSGFDTHVLSLFDSIEQNRDDIDAKLESLRVFLKGAGVWDRVKNGQKLSYVYTSAAAALVRPQRDRSRMAMQQLLANWRMVGHIGANEGLPKAPKTWIRPLFSDGAPLPTGGGELSRNAIVLNAPAQAIFVAAFFAIFITMIVYVFRSDLPMTTLLLVGAGIFVAVVLAHVFGLIRPYQRPGAIPPKRS